LELNEKENGRKKDDANKLAAMKLAFAQNNVHTFPIRVQAPKISVKYFNEVVKSGAGHGNIFN
jgi:hypothetical protein